jgi:hypothetical protein
MPLVLASQGLAFAHGHDGVAPHFHVSHLVNHLHAGHDHGHDHGTPDAGGSPTLTADADHDSDAVYLTTTVAVTAKAPDAGVMLQLLGFSAAVVLEAAPAGDAQVERALLPAWFHWPGCPIYVLTQKLRN